MDVTLQLDPKLDLVFKRITPVPVEHLWQGWTHPEILKKWFCPQPWHVTDCRIELKAGGAFDTVMEGPDGAKMINHGCYLEVVECKRLVWTGMMTKGFRPAKPSPAGFQFVATILMTSMGKQTSYEAVLAHADEEGRAKHEKMGFQEGWGKAFDQLVALWNK